VARGVFQVHPAAHVSEGIALLTGQPAGLADGGAPFADGSVLALAEQTLLDYRRACLRAGQGLRGRRGRR
jgi:hypothetical protein